MLGSTEGKEKKEIWGHPDAHRSERLKPTRMLLEIPRVLSREKFALAHERVPEAITSWRLKQ